MGQKSATIKPTIPVQTGVAYALGADDFDRIFTTQSDNSPLISSGLADGFRCSIISCAQDVISWSADNVKFVLPGDLLASAGNSFSLMPGQSCVLSAAKIGDETVYFVGKTVA